MTEKKKTTPRKKASAPEPTCPGEACFEKNGKLLLTSSEYREIQKGTVPDRLKKEWNLTLTEARDLLQCSFYELVDASPKGEG